MPYFNPDIETKIFYTMHGANTSPPLLLIHGWCCNSHDWNFQIEFLSLTFHVIAFDLRGYGHSSAPENSSYRIEDHMSDSILLLRHLGYYRDVVIAGHSMGGIIASAMSIADPELVKALIVVDTLYFNIEESSSQVIAAYDAADGHVHTVNLQIWPSLYAADAPQWMKTWYHRRLEETPAHVIRACVEGTCPGRMDISMDQHFEQRRKSHVPRLAICTNDVNVQREKDLGLKALDEVVLMDGMGHWPHHGNPDEFNKTMIDWLKRLGVNQIN